MLKKLLLFGFAGLAVLTVGILIGHFGIQKGSSAPEWVQELSHDVDEDFIQKFIAEVDNMRIEENLKELTKVPHMATTAGDEATVQFMLRRWQDKDSGLDAAWREDYRVYLSFPNKDTPNKVTVVNPDDAVLHTVQEKEKAYYPEQDDPEVVQPYAAYGPAGHAKGRLVYANQGKVSDYEHLNRTIDLRGTIAIVRYGGAGRGAKAINAAPFGVVGVLVYTEPYDMNDGLMNDNNETYPNSWYLPPSGVERGSYTSDFGDPLTPYLAAKSNLCSTDINGVPPIPIQPIGFEDAQILICELGGTAAPADWQGSFPCIYNLGGPGFTSTSHRYVIYGNHRDSWVHGAIDPSSGTAVMLEISRILGQRVKAGTWRPRRTIIFGSWGAEEFGLIGSAEYAEEYISKLSQRTVAYINVDISVFANATLRASASPIAENVILTASKQVKAAGSNTVSVYDNWIKYFNKTSPTYGLIPDVGYLTGAGSDYAPFIHYLGISSMDISYTYDRSKTRARIYPAYHTAYDTFDYASRFIDPGFTSHQTVARTAGNVLLRLADSFLLPFNCSDYAESLEGYLSAAVKNFEEHLKNFFLRRKCFFHANKNSYITQSLFYRPLKARRINDQLMLLDRAFVDPLAFPNKYCYSSRHVIWASRSSGVATFPGLADAVEKALATGLKEDWNQAHRHLSIVTQAISGAAHTLAELI
uniref:Peptidase M28 domain-containing protein n=1 Tax=Pygocentrus nattereri TaxID=42514 RepID=A0AAR2LXB8_PYGNA